MTSKQQIYLIEPLAIEDDSFIHLKQDLKNELDATYEVKVINQLPFDFIPSQTALTCVLYLFDSDSTAISKMMANFSRIALSHPDARCCVALACLSRDHYKSLTVLDHLMHEFNERGWMVHPHHTVIDASAIRNSAAREAFVGRLRLFFQNIPAVRMKNLPAAKPS